MSRSSNPRVVRQTPKRSFTEATYRKALPYLLQEFSGRCAYSMQHERVVGWKCMEVDHFNPLLLGLGRNRYSNLFPATRHCNGSKRDLWPDAHYRSLGARFLNPTKEQDYGLHIFEDATSNELVGVTPEGRYHIRCCDLNAPHLVGERRKRSALQRLLDESMVTLKKPILLDPNSGPLDGLQSENGLLDVVAILRDILADLIPPIPPPPNGP